MQFFDHDGRLRWPRVRAVLAWVALLAMLALRVHQAWHNFDEEHRPDGNSGHAQIDFAGQYMFGRLIREGHSHELYSRERHLAVARERFGAVGALQRAPDREKAAETAEGDAARLITWYPSTSDKKLAGPLYPPIQAFVMAPIAGVDDPQLAYRIWQSAMLGCLLLAGFGVRLLTNGRWWCSVATLLLISFAGSRAGIDLGQNSAITTMLAIFGWLLRVRGRPILAGMVWGLMAFKPVWALSFFGALVFLRQWRMLFAMGGTGLALILITLPFVGIDSWKNWLEIGKIASETYNTDRNWINLSRDLFGIPRRYFLVFNEFGEATNDRPMIARLGWGIWGFVFVVTAFVSVRRRCDFSTFGPGPAMVLLAWWMLTYRFMYYDSQIACFAIFVLLANPKKWLRWSSWPVASWGIFWAMLPVLFENFVATQDFEFTVIWHRRERRLSFNLNDAYPCETFVLFFTWLWCVRTVWFRWEKSFE